MRMTEEIRECRRLFGRAINDACHQVAALLSGTCTESRPGAVSGAAEEAGSRTAKEVKAQEETARRARGAAEARAREEAIRRAAEARACEQSRLRDEAYRRAQEQARHAQARLSALLYDDIVVALTRHETKASRVLPAAIGRSLRLLRVWQSRLLGHAARG